MIKEDIHALELALYLFTILMRTLHNEKQMLALVVALFTICNGTTILLGKKFEILLVGIMERSISCSLIKIRNNENNCFTFLYTGY